MFFHSKSYVVPLRRCPPNLFGIINDHAEGFSPDIRPALLFEEILRSYCLVFGQDEQSWKAFSKMLSKLEEDQGQWRTISACDPPLRVLCGLSSTSFPGSHLFRFVCDSLDANLHQFADLADNSLETANPTGVRDN